MRWLLALLVGLCVSSASAQDYFYSSSYSYPDYGGGYSTSTYGFGDRGETWSSSSWTSPSYGGMRSTSTFGFGSRGNSWYESSYDYSPRYSYGSSRTRLRRW